MNKFKLSITFSTDDEDTLKTLNSNNLRAMFIKEYTKEIKEDNEEMEDISITIERIED